MEQGFANCVAVARTFFKSGTALFSHFTFEYERRPRLDPDKLNVHVLQVMAFHGSD
jgi:hypothetical protein